MQLKKTPAKSSKPAKKLGNLRAKIEEMQKKNNTPQKAPAHAPPPTPQPQSMPVKMESLEEDDEMVIKKEHEVIISMFCLFLKEILANVHDSIKIHASGEQSKLRNDATRMRQVGYESFDKRQLQH